MPEIKKKRVGILRGGIENNYHSSLRQGGDIILHLFQNLNHKYTTLDILIDKDGVWHCNGLPIVPADLFHKVDVVWNVTHPSMSILLDNLSIPNIKINSFVSMLDPHSTMFREYMKNIDVLIPRSVISPKSAHEVFVKFGSPWQVGDKLIQTFSELDEIIKNNKNILVKEFIVGKVVSVHALLGFRGEDIYVFPPIDIFGKISMTEKDRIIDIAKDLHKHTHTNTYLKMSFVINKRGKIYLLDIDSVPDLSKDSYYLPQVCEKVGAKMHHIVEHILENSFVIK